MLFQKLINTASNHLFSRDLAAVGEGGIAEQSLHLAAGLTLRVRVAVAGGGLDGVTVQAQGNYSAVRSVRQIWGLPGHRNNALFLMFYLPLTQSKALLQVVCDFRLVARFIQYLS